MSDMGEGGLPRAKENKKTTGLGISPVSHGAFSVEHVAVMFIFNWGGCTNSINVSIIEI